MECKTILKRTLYNPLIKHSILNFLINSSYIPITIILSKLLSQLTLDATVGKFSLVLKTGLIILAVEICFRVLMAAVTIINQRFVSNQLHKCKMSLYDIFLNNPLYVLRSENQGQSIEKLSNDFNTATSKYLYIYPTIISSTFTIIAYASVLGIQNWLIMIILLGFSLIQIVPHFTIMRKTEKNYDENRKVEAEITDFVIEGHRAFTTIKNTNSIAWWMNKLKTLHCQYLKIGKNGIYLSATKNVLAEFVSILLKYGTYATIGVLVLFGKVPINLGIQAIVLSSGLFSGVNSIFASISKLAIIKVAEKRLEVWFVKTSKINTLIRNSEIVLTDVKFSYEEQIIFQNANIKIESNQITVVKGQNGAGKSTLFHLIVGMLRCSQGEILVDGKANISDDNFPNNVFYLPQDDEQFNITVNEFCESIGIDRQKISMIMKDFGFQKKFYDSHINELSGGERKKFYLSLAFSINPKILLLDEPTNSLDERSKNVLKKYVEKFSHNIVIITHDDIFDDISHKQYFISTEGDIYDKK